MDAWVPIASDACSGPVHGCGSGRWLGLFFRLLIAYLILAALCWIELGFRDKSVDVEANFEIAGAGPKNTVWVRYHFRDPVTGKPRMGTEVVHPDRVPAGQTTTVEYIPGEFPSSRLKSEARPEIPPIFFWLNVVFVTGLAGLIGYIAWEANRPLVKRKRGRIPYHPNPSRKRWNIG
jgi:hypothetical protein